MLKSVLFSPFKIRNLVLKNRFQRSACYMKGCNEQGFPKKWVLDYYRDMADGQMGLIVPGYLHLGGSAQALPLQGSIESDAHAESWKDCVDYIHRQGSAIIFQVADGGYASRRSLIGTLPRGPSAIFENTREMTVSEIDDVIERFAKAAKRLEKIGADGLQIHGAHGYLISEFLSPFGNRRTDKYGGSPENRARIVNEIISHIRRDVSKDFIVAIKMNVNDNREGGVTPDIAAETVKNIPDLDFIELSSGFIGTGSIRSTHKEAKHKDFPYFKSYNVEGGQVVRRKNPGRIISIVGGLREFKQMEDLIESNKADLVSLGRPSISDPKLVLHFMEGRDKVDCVNCGLCIARMENSVVRCHVNKSKWFENGDYLL